MPRLRDEIKMTRPFESPEAEAFLNIQRTADALTRGLEETLRPSGLTQAQYNVLRILRGAGDSGLLCRELGERMVTRDPDITRLLDRLESRSLVRRERDPRDRRSIVTRITREGLSVLAELDTPVAQLHKRQLAHLDPEQTIQLVALLEAARTGC
jgi:DNA-binding MarR family transcriptional regulator